MNPYWNHLKTITRHKFIVMSECFKCGQIVRGLIVSSDLLSYKLCFIPATSLIM